MPVENISNINKNAKTTDTKWTPLKILKVSYLQNLLLTNKNEIIR